MSKGPLVLWLLTELWALYLTPAAAQTVVTAFLGQSVTLPCMHASWSRRSNSMCWGKGWCPKSKCNEEILHTDGARVLSRKSAKYDLQGNIQRGDVSLTIFNTNEGDSSVYCCRIEVPGWFNDIKKNIRLTLSKAPATTHRPTTHRPTTHRPTPTTTAMTTTTAVLPTTATTTPDLTTRTPLHRRTTAALTTTTTCPLTSLQTTEPVTEGTILMAESETSLASEATTRDTAFLTSKESKPWVLQSTTQSSTWEMTSERVFVHNEVETEQIRGVDSSLLLKIIASSLGFVLCALTVVFLLRGKVMKTNCFRKHTRLNNTGDSKNVLDDMQHGREDEDGLFTL